MILVLKHKQLEIYQISRLTKYSLNAVVISARVDCVCLTEVLFNEIFRIKYDLLGIDIGWHFTLIEIIKKIQASQDL